MNSTKSFLLFAEDSFAEIRWPKYFILLTGSLFTVLFTLFLYSIDRIRNIQAFEYACRDASSRVLNRLRSHELVLKTSAAFFESSDSVTSRDWQNFVIKSDILEILPGIRKVGFSSLVKEEDPDRLITSVLYLEPNDNKLKWIGFDLFKEAECSSAMKMARDSDMATVSGSCNINSTGNGPTRPGLVMFSPVFMSGEHDVIVHNKSSFRGWTFNPFRMDELVNGTQGLTNFLEEAGIQMKIYSSSTSGLLYESTGFNESAGKRRDYSVSVPLKFNNAEFILRFNKKNNAFILSAKEIIILTSGTIITILTYLLFLSVINTGRNARVLALKLTKELKERENELMRATATKDKIYSIIAHDLRSPFNAMLGLTEIIGSHLEKNDIGKAAKLTKMLNSNAEQTLSLLENLLEWTKSQSGLIDFRPDTHLLAPVINRVTGVFHTFAQIKNISINIILESENLSIYADLSMLETILRNLISNAIKFTDKGGRIVISASAYHDKTEISVEDNGTGIDPQITADLFSKTSYTSKAGTSDEKGSGLGLILCREFVEKHRGEISVLSLSGTGSKFTFSLPTP